MHPAALAIIKYWPMSQTDLHSGLASADAQIGAYNGVEATLSFGSAANELAALRNGCGVFALPWRTQINVTGKDRTRWLHNMVTNNVRDLAVNRGNYNFVLNAQGRILGDMYIFNRGESFVIQTDARQVEPLVSAMKKFIIMDKVELTPEGSFAALGVCGPKSAVVFSAMGIDTSGMPSLEMRDLTIEGISTTLISGPEKKPGWFELWVDQAHAQDIWNKLVNAGARRAGAEALEVWRVLHGIPNYGQDIRQSDLPPETAQTDALNFTKGCYIGQEIVERIRSRGHVHRQFTGFEFPNGAPTLSTGEPDRKAQAEITSVASIPTPAGEKTIGLGYCRREVMESSPQIDVNGVAATVVDLPFEIH